MLRNAIPLRWTGGFAGLALAASGAAFAWGNAGHETVGAIADRLIAGRPAEARVLELLKPGENLQKVSVWADCAKGYCGRMTLEMREFVAANPQHARYHYTDVPFEEATYRDGGVGTRNDDVVHILEQCIRVLQGSGGRRANPHGFTRRQALLLLVHLVADIHQPLHVAPAYVSDKDEFIDPPSQEAVDGTAVFNTDGDNDLVLGTRPLHAYWDGQTVRYAMRQAGARGAAQWADVLGRAIPDVPIINGDVTSWPAKWATETLAASKQAHADLTLETREEGEDRAGEARFIWPVAAPVDYAQRSSSLAAIQITRAGYRLAAVLETLWH